MGTRRRAGRLAVVVGLLFSLASSTVGAEEAASCDTAELEQALATAQRQVATLQAANQALSSANQTLTEDGERTRAELAEARATVEAFVNRLFGEPVGGAVAAAARSAALADLAAARAAAPTDRRLRGAQDSFDQGQHAMRRQEWGRAVHEFRVAHELAERIRADRHPRESQPR